MMMSIFVVLIKVLKLDIELSFRPQKCQKKVLTTQTPIFSKDITHN